MAVSLDFRKVGKLENFSIWSILLSLFISNRIERKHKVQFYVLIEFETQILSFGITASYIGYSQMKLFKK